MNEELKTMFENGVTVGTEVIEAAHLRYKGRSKRFVIWTVSSNTPAFSADDVQLYSIYSVDISVASDGNLIDILAAVKALMLENGFIWTEDSPEMYDDDTNLFHITASFEKERMI